MTLDDMILELYRLAETREWNGEKSDESLFAAIECMEHIWTLKQSEKRRVSTGSAAKRQPRIWS